MRESLTLLPQRNNKTKSRDLPYSSGHKTCALAIQLSQTSETTRNKTKSRDLSSASEIEAPFLAILLSQRSQAASTESKSQDLLCSPGDEALVVLTIPLSQTLEMKQLRQKREAEL